jgi:arachidonate 5-lipoxygenase
LIANFRNGINKLIITGGFFDQVMTIGRAGALELIGRKYIWALYSQTIIVFDKFIFRFQQWRVDEDGNMEKELKKRGVFDPEVLPYYPYRDDGVQLYRLIREEYVAKVVKVFYGKSGYFDTLDQLC